MNPLSDIFGKTRAVENLLSRGDSALYSGNFKVAEEFFEDALENLDKLKSTQHVNQQIIQSLVGMAMAVDGQGRREEIYQYFDKALDVQGNHDDVYATLVKLIKPDEMLNESALRVLKKSYEKKKSNEFILKLYAQALWDNNIFDQRSLEIYDRAHQADPNFPKAIKGLGKALAQSNRWDERAMKIHRRLQKLEPENKEHLKNIALCYASMDPPPDEAYQVMIKARELFPDEQAIFDGLTNYYLHTDEMREAIYEHLKEAYEKKPSRAVAEKLLPYLLRNNDTSDWAIAIYEQHYFTHPKREQILAILSEHYIRTGRNDDFAVEILEALFALNPRARNNASYLGRIYARDGRFDDQAKRIYETIYDEESEDTPHEIISALARVFINDERKDSIAREIYFRELEIKPHDIDALKMLGSIAFMKKHLDDRDYNILLKLFKTPSIKDDFKLQVAKSLVKILPKRKPGQDIAQEVYEFLWKKGAELPQEAITELGMRRAKSEIVDTKDIKLFEEILKIRYNPNIGWALAKVYMLNNRQDNQAIALYLRVLQDDPTNQSIIKFMAPKVLEEREIQQKYYPIIMGLLEVDPKLLMNKIAKTQGIAFFIKTGRFYLKRGDFDNAFKILNFTHRNFKDSVLDYLLGISLLEKGDLKTAQSIFIHLVKNEPQNPLYQYRLGHLALLEKKYSEAEKIFKNLLKSYPGHPLLNARMGMLYEVKGDWANARNHYEILVKAGGDFAPYGHLMLAIESFRHNRDDSHEEKLKQYIDDSYFGQLLARCLAKRRFDLGVRSFREEKYQEAVHNWEIASNFIETTELQRALSEAHFRYGVQLFKRSDLVNSETHLIRAREIDNKSGGPDLMLGILNHVTNKPIRARTNYQNVINNYPDVREDALVFLGRLDLGKKNYLAANESFELALEYEKVHYEALLGRMISFYQNTKERDFPRALENRDYFGLYQRGFISLPFLGVIFFRGGRYEEGVKVIEKAFEKDSDVQTHFVLGLLNIYLNKKQIAFHYWSDIPSLLRKTDFPLEQKLQMLYAMGYYYLEEEMIDKANEIFDEVERFSPSNVDLNIARSLTYIHRGYLDAKAGNLDRSVGSWQHALKLSPSSLMALQNLALAYIIKTKPQEALALWEQYYDLLEKKVQRFPDEDSVVELNESRRILNTLRMVSGDETTFQLAVRKEILIDNIENVNKYYWTLNLEKGATAEDAKKSYFRLIRTYNPERYPEEFKQIEEAYQFFNDEDRFRKAQSLIFNGFSLHKTLRVINLPFKWGIPELPAIIESCSKFVDTKHFVSEIKFQTYYRTIDFEKILPEYPTHEFVLDDYLTDW